MSIQVIRMDRRAMHLKSPVPIGDQWHASSFISYFLFTTAQSTSCTMLAFCRHAYHDTVSFFFFPRISVAVIDMKPRYSISDIRTERLARKQLLSSN